ncbi:hypothetical protein BU15DRAFT_54458 [Melanogaster broomeanus]|nr:hypothetical protein BU15DRAFT_54458 [Melanogaster broomeanus]
MSTDRHNTKTVAVLGGSYGGYRAAQVLAAGLPSGWRVVLVDRNSHFNHVYNFPRYAVLPGHEHKAFIPYDNIFNNPSLSSSALHRHRRVHGTITSLHSHHITYIPHTSSDPSTSTPHSALLLQPGKDEEHEQSLHFDYAIYALGSHLPSPINLWESRDANILKILVCIRLYVPRGRGKHEGISWLRSRQRIVAEARNVVVVGGGALGIRDNFASDIAAIYPRKRVTLLHSRSNLLPRFDEALGDEVLQGLQELGVRIILGERLDISSLKDDGRKTRLIKTMKGLEFELICWCLLCTGQTPNTSLLHSMDPRTIDPKSGMICIARSMQILVESASAPYFEPRLSVYPHLFAIGDAANAFGAIKAGHTAYYQGEVAARNVITLVKRDEAADVELELEEYTPGPPMIKVTLGLTKSAYEVSGVVGTSDDGTEDLGAARMWSVHGYREVDEEGMWR